MSPSPRFLTQCLLLQNQAVTSGVGTFQTSPFALSPRRGRDALVDIAIGLYKREQASLGRAAEISGLSSPEFPDELGRRRIPVNYEAEDLRVDLDTLKRLS